MNLEARDPEEIAQTNASAEAAKLREVIVFCTLAVLGGALIAVVLITRISFYYPFLFYLAAASFAWERYFISPRRKTTSQISTASS